MFPNPTSIVFLWITTSVFSALANLAPPNHDIQLREDFDISQPLGYSPLVKRAVYNTNATLDKSWNDATIFNVKVAKTVDSTDFDVGLDIVCTTCYIKGRASAQLRTIGSFDVSQAFDHFILSIEQDVGNISNETVSSLKNWALTLKSKFLTAIADGNASEFVDSLTLPTLNNTNFNIALPSIPQAHLTFQLDGLDIYAEINTNLSASATYTFPIYKPETNFNLFVGNNSVDIDFEVDLILSADGEIDISSGFHIKLNDGFVIDMALFGNNVSSVTNKGGNFEFLPVTVQTANVKLDAILQVGLKAGVNINAPKISLQNQTFATFSAGAGAGVTYNIAEFTTNITAAAPGNPSGCDLLVEEVYTMAIGAEAGATLAVGRHKWGPTPSTSKVIYETTLARHCAIRGTSSPAPPLVTARALGSGFSTTELSTTDTYTATRCISPGVLNCPISLQSTMRQTIASTTTITYSGSDGPTAYPTSISNVGVKAIAFGSSARALATGTGNPDSFNPTALPPFLDRTTRGVSNKIIIGVCVGGGLLVILGIGIGAWCCVKRRRASMDVVEIKRGGASYSANQAPESVLPGWGASKKSPFVVADEVR